MNGILLVDKPTGMTSHDVVDKVRKAAKMRKIGHTGTLDPAATGLLVLCLGAATRLSEHFTALGKVYEGTMRLGLSTTSYDLQGEVVSEREVPDLDRAAIQARCDAFLGAIEQIPPMVSAVRIGGERLYKKARKGEVIERPPRPVQVDRFEVLSYEAPDAVVSVACSSGTYVRSLCHDVGEALECGAVLASLRRLSVGKHHVDNAATLEELTGPDAVSERLLPMGSALELPVGIVNPDALPILANGGTLSSGNLVEGCPITSGWLQLKNSEGELLALAQVESTPVEAFVHPKRVFYTGRD
ncbi:MAG: tRNA pseudouridine(55) synthase TruB [Candidatus Hydrogenedentes bacterium]|nr:tRNA pseudouridine(55) synthase TruB [Candidatus Hydrogenedentota bacterium]